MLAVGLAAPARAQDVTYYTAPGDFAAAAPWLTTPTETFSGIDPGAGWFADYDAPFSNATVPGLVPGVTYTDENCVLGWNCSSEIGVLGANFNYDGINAVTIAPNGGDLYLMFDPSVNAVSFYLNTTDFPSDVTVNVYDSNGLANSETLPDVPVVDSSSFIGMTDPYPITEIDLSVEDDIVHSPP